MDARATRRSPRGERRRSEILAAAMSEFAACGYRGASLASIAERAGITQSGILHHYPTKELLLDAVIEDRFRSDAELVDQESAQLASPFAAYTLLADRNIQDATWAQFLTVLSAEALTQDHPARAVIGARLRVVRERLRRRLAAFDADGAVTGGLDGDVLASLLVAAMNGLQLQWLHDPEVDMVAGMEMLIDLAARASTADDPSPARG